MLEKGRTARKHSNTHIQVRRLRLVRQKFLTTKQLSAVETGHSLVCFGKMIITGKKLFWRRLPNSGDQKGEESLRSWFKLFKSDFRFINPGIGWASTPRILATREVETALKNSSPRKCTIQNPCQENLDKPLIRPWPYCALYHCNIRAFHHFIDTEIFNFQFIVSDSQINILSIFYFQF